MEDRGEEIRELERDTDGDRLEGEGLALTEEERFRMFPEERLETLRREEADCPRTGEADRPVI